RHLRALLARIDVPALQALLSQLRGAGLRCRIPALSPTASAPGDDEHTTATTAGSASPDLEAVTRQMGGQNAHLDAVFEDGVTWIVRIRLSCSPLQPPQRVQDAVA
ncbi:hypothetical protein KEM55_007352, partial [Ascosphaera atra]